MPAKTDELWPRQYAAQIAAMKSLAERRAAVEAVPEHLRPIVKTHLTIRAERVRYANQTGK